MATCDAKDAKDIKTIGASAEPKEKMTVADDFLSKEEFLVCVYNNGNARLPGFVHGLRMDAAPPGQEGFDNGIWLPPETRGTFDFHGIEPIGSVSRFQHTLFNPDPTDTDPIVMGVFSRLGGGLKAFKCFQDMNTPGTYGFKMEGILRVDLYPRRHALLPGDAHVYVRTKFVPPNWLLHKLDTEHSVTFDDLFRAHRETCAPRTQ